MKKFLTLFFIFLILTSCNGNQNNSNSSSTISSSDIISSITTSSIIDNVAPILQIEPLQVTIKYAEDYDFLTGVIAVDDIDGDVKNLVVINLLDFDKNKAGTYTVIYMAKDKSNNMSNIIQRSITVLEKEPTIDEIGYTNRTVYLQSISGEVAQPTTTPSCFPGAWYRKVVSTKDKWLGIEGIVQLPTYEFDESRYDSVNKRYLDNPSIYMGGHALNESDVGLSLMKGCDRKEGCTTANLTESYFRPFWRYITDAPNPGKYDGYSVSCVGNNCFANADFTKTQFYYVPGDVIRMSVFVVENSYMQLKIELIEASTFQKYVTLRQTIGQPETFLSPKFKSNGQGVYNSEFKRVNAIDQVNNEGKPTTLTGTKILDAIWRESYLYRKIGEEVYKVPFVERRASYMTCPISGNEGNTNYPYQAFTISHENVDRSLGGEIVSIHPKSINFSN